MNGRPEVALVILLVDMGYRVGTGCSIVRKSDARRSAGPGAGGNRIGSPCILRRFP